MLMGVGILGPEHPRSRRERLIRATGRGCCRPRERSDPGILSGLSFRTHEKKPIRQDGLLHLFDAWQFPTLAWGDPTLPSALRRFTSEFGMGSGGTTALLPPGKFCLSTHSLSLSI